MSDESDEKMGGEQNKPILHKKWEMASINMGSLAIELIQGVLSILLFYFYH